jgi:dCTP deaminase
MAILTKRQLKERIVSGSVVFHPPLDQFQLHAHSVDLRLGFTFLVPKLWDVSAGGRKALNLSHLEKNNKHNFQVIELEQGQFFEVLPQEHILVSTLETITVPKDLMCVLYPRSSTNRRGLTVDLTGIIDAGYQGPLTIPVRNNTRGQVIRLFPGERFCQLVFQELLNEVQPRQSKYHRKDVADGYVQDKNGTEVDYVLKGDLKGLKEKFPIE